MTYSLGKWIHPKTGEVRLYLNGSTRKIYFLMSVKNGVVWSSKTNETPHKFQTGNHYGKINKDRAAANNFADLIEVNLGEVDGADHAWKRMLKIAESGMDIKDDGDE